MRRLMVVTSILLLFASVVSFFNTSSSARAAVSPLGTYESCQGTCGCQPKSQAPVVAAGSVVNECGMVSSALVNGNTVTAFDWGESATLSADGSTLAWQDGSNWVRTAVPTEPNQPPGTTFRCRVHETAISGVNWPGLDTWHGSCAAACQNNGQAWSAYYHSQYPNAEPFSYGLTPDGNGCIEYHAGTPYSTWGFEKDGATRGQQAAAKSKELEGAPYLLGGKGQDIKTGAPLSPQQIKDGYPYWDPSTGQRTENGKGVDCSGLVKWTYNSTRADSEIYIDYNNADGQYLKNSTPINAADLQDGDLLFFGDNNRKVHVAIFIGDGKVIEAPNPEVPVRITTLSEASKRPNFYGFSRVTAPRYEGKGMTKSPIGMILTDPQGITISDQTIEITENEILTEVPGELYYSVQGVDQQGWPEDVITIPTLKTGDYFIKPTPKPGTAPGDTFGLEITIHNQLLTLAEGVAIADIPPLGYGFHVSSNGTVALFKPVNVIIKPGDSQPTINPKSNGALTMAILSDRTFNATLVDIPSLRLGLNGSEAKAVAIHIEDVNNDGLADVWLKFRTPDTQITCAATALHITGKNANGQILQGKQPIVLSNNCSH